MLRRLLLAAAAALFVSGASAQTLVVDQNPAPVPTQCLNPELMTQSYAVSGGTLYLSTLSQSSHNGGACVPVAVSQTFVPVAAGGSVRYLMFARAKTDAGVGMTASTASGVMAITRVAGSSFVLTTEAANSSTITDKVIFDFALPDTYVAGASISFVINGTISGASCVLTAGTTVLTPSLYTELNGVEAIAVGAITGATQWTKTTQTDYTFVQVGTGLTPGMHVVFEIVAAITASNANNCTGTINSVKYTG